MALGRPGGARPLSCSGPRSLHNGRGRAIGRHPIPERPSPRAPGWIFPRGCSLARPFQAPGGPSQGLRPGGLRVGELRSPSGGRGGGLTPASACTAPSSLPRRANEEIMDWNRQIDCECKRTRQLGAGCLRARTPRHCVPAPPRVPSLRILWAGPRVGRTGTFSPSVSLEVIPQASGD